MSTENDTYAPLTCRNPGEMSFWTQTFMTVLGNPGPPRATVEEALAAADTAVREGRKRVPNADIVVATPVVPKAH